MPHHHWQPYWNHHFYKRYSMFWGPSRLVWFAFGSVATWAWIRHHENRHHQGACPPRVGYGHYPGRAQWERERERDQPAPANASSPGPDYGQWQRPTQTQTQQSEGSMTPMMDRDHERLRQMGRNAEETISGMSEVTIDSMMGALQRLKERLAERRGQQQLEEIQVGSQQANPTPAASPEEKPLPHHRV